MPIKQRNKNLYIYGVLGSNPGRRKFDLTP